MKGDSKRWHAVSGHTTYLGRSCHRSERAERVIKQTFVYILIEVSNEEVCAHVELLFVRRRLEIPNEVGHMKDMVQCGGGGAETERKEQESISAAVHARE